MAHAGGRPPKFETPELLWDAFESYKLEFQDEGKLKNEIPDVESFCVYVDSYRQLLMEYEKKEEFSVTVKKIKDWLYYQKKQLAMQNKMNAAVYIFDAKNNHGYVDKTEQDLTSGGEKIEPKSVDTDVLTQFMMTMKDQTKQ